MNAETPRRREKREEENIGVLSSSLHFSASWRLGVQQFF